MAAVLIRWKSSLLLPPKVQTKKAESDPEKRRQPEDLRQDLIRQLLGRARELAGELDRRLEHESRFGTPLTRPNLWEPDGPEPEIWSAPFFSAWDVIQQAKELRDWVIAHREEQQERERDALQLPEASSSVEEMRAWAEERLCAAPLDFWLSAEPLFLEAETHPRQCCLFLAFLELARTGCLALAQQEAFSTLYLCLLGERAT